MRRWTLPLSLATLAALVLPTGCVTGGNGRGGGRGAAAGRTVEVVATDFEYTPSRITVDRGQPVTVRLVNRGSSPHNIEFELPAGERELEQNVPPGGTGTLRFTAPQEPGVYEVYCPVANHKGRGMTGTLVVR